MAQKSASVGHSRFATPASVVSSSNEAASASPRLPRKLARRAVSLAIARRRALSSARLRSRA
jgi:hypothetical protein